MKSIRRLEIPVYPFLLALLSVLSMVSVNVSEIELFAAVRTLLFIFLFTAIVFLFYYLILRDNFKAALLTFISLLLFSTYGHIYDLLQQPILGVFLGQHSYIAGACLVILGLSIWSVIRTKHLAKWTWSLNLILSIAVLIPLFQIIAFYVRDAKANRDLSGMFNTEEQTPALSAVEKPDIYYIILDSYTREDALLSDLNFNNSSFINALSNRGFYLADCSRSNYAHTRLSLSSSLNMNYLPELGVDLSDNSRKMGSMNTLIQNSTVRKQLSYLGYQTVAFQTGYRFTDMKDADIYYKATSNILFSPYVEPFEFLFLKNSAFRLIMDTQTDFMDHYFQPVVFPFSGLKIRVLNIFNHLPEIPEIAGPKFVFVHLEIPHHPFIFMPDGSINPDKRYYPGVNMPGNELIKVGYVNQIKFVNSQIISIVDDILAKSKIPPIIILQGDHGLGSDNRVKILNAIYLPDGNTDSLYASISPVNTFRLIFNQYFGTEMSLLDDVTYFSDYEDKMELTLLGETSANCRVK
jgi:hypothetical protein